MKHISQNRGKTKPLQRRIFYYAFSGGIATAKEVLEPLSCLTLTRLVGFARTEILRIRIFPFFRKVAVQACHLLRTALFLGLDGILEPWSMNQNHQSNSGQRLIQSVCKHSHPVLCLYYQPRRKSRIYHVTFHHCLRSEVSAIGSGDFFFFTESELSVRFVFHSLTLDRSFASNGCLNIQLFACINVLYVFLFWYIWTNRMVSTSTLKWYLKC